MELVATAASVKDLDVITLAKNVAEGAKSTRPGVRQMLLNFRALANLIKQRPIPIYISIPSESEREH